MSQLSRYKLRPIFIGLLAILALSPATASAAPSLHHTTPRLASLVTHQAAMPASGCALMSGYNALPSINGVYVNEPAYILSEGEVLLAVPLCDLNVETNAERYVCGVFGCSYNVEASTGYQADLSTSFEQEIAQTCASGTHSYRTALSLEFLELTGPQYVDTYASNSYSCG